MSNTVQDKRLLKGPLLRNKILILVLALFVIALILTISLTQLRRTGSSRFEVYEAGGNYLIYVQFDKTFIVPVKIKGVSIESNKPDLPVEKEIMEWGIWVDNYSLLGAMKLTNEELSEQKQRNVANYLVNEKVKFTVFFRPAVDSMDLSESFFNQSIIIHYSVFGYPKEVRYQLNR